MNQVDRNIIKGLADNNMSVNAVSRNLYCHRNTVEYHIKRVEKETGLNPKRFYDLVKLVEMAKG